MSFSSDFKAEILEKKFKKDSEKLSFISSVVRQCGSIHINHFGVNIEVESDIASLIQLTANIFKDLYKIDIEIEIKQNSNSHKFYKISLPQEITKIIAETTGLIEYFGSVAIGFSQGVTNELISREDIRAYLIGVVASSASISIPQPTNIPETYVGGYHFEIAFASEQMSYDVMNLFAVQEITFKKLLRGDMYCIYIKDSNVLCDLLAFLGANNAVLELNSIIVSRSVRNNVNRTQNCTLANIDKAIEASQKQINAINIIEKAVGIVTLKQKLQDVCNIRLLHPEYTLEQIGLELPEKLLKSGVNHRLKAIFAIAEELKTKHE